MRVAICLNCNKEFVPMKQSKGKYCSWDCSRKAWKSPANAVKFQKGHTPWLKGVKGLQPWHNTSGLKPAEKGRDMPWLWKIHKAVRDNGTMLGEKNPAWRGGVKPLHLKIRHSYEMQEWRKAIFERDDWTCQICNVRGGKLNADHIKSFSLYPELRFELNNGRTLCWECHKQTDTFGGRSRIYG